MGKGDIKTKKGKQNKGSYGNMRKHKLPVEVFVQKVAPEKKAPAKKAAPKKTTAKKKAPAKEK